MKSRGETRKKITRRKRLSQKFAAGLQKATQAIDITNSTNMAGTTLGRGCRRQSLSGCMQIVGNDSYKHEARDCSDDHNNEDDINEESQGLVSHNGTPSPNTNSVSHCLELNNPCKNIGDDHDGVDEEIWDSHIECHGQDADIPSSFLRTNDTTMNQKLYDFETRDMKRTLFEFEDVQTIDNHDEEEKVEIG